MQHKHDEDQRVHIRTALESVEAYSRFMLGTIAIVLIVLWLLGMVSSTTIGGFVHVLLVVAVIIVLVQFIQGRRVFSK